MSDEKSPYGKFSIEDITKAETDHFVIQIGSELFALPNGKMAFTKERIDALYEEVLEGLNIMRKEGTDIEQEQALQGLLLLKIHPLRIH